VNAVVKVMFELVGVTEEEGAEEGRERKWVTAPKSPPSLAVGERKESGRERNVRVTNESEDTVVNLLAAITSPTQEEPESQPHSQPHSQPQS
jgi:hypothetical protein